MSIVDKKRFKDGHYFGLPADFDDLFVKTRVELVKNIRGFVGTDLLLADVGCGNGNSLFLLSPFFAHADGIDLYPENQIVFEKIRSELNCSNCSFVIKDIESENLDRQYDRIICFEVIEHFKSEESVGKLFEILKDGGMLAITVPHKWWLFETHGARLPLLPWNRVPFFSWLPRPIHEKYANARIYTKQRIVKLLMKHGFEVKSAQLMTAPLDVLKDSALKRFLLKVVFRGQTTRNPFLATNVFVWAVKSKS